MKHKNDRFLLVLWLALFPALIWSATIDTPVFSYDQGTYNEPLSITISCSTPDADIYYTVDGSEPTKEALLYQGIPILAANHASGNVLTGQSSNDPDSEDENVPLTTSSLTLKALAVKGGMEDSPIAEAVYVIDMVDASLNVAYDTPPPEGGGKHLLDVYQPAGKTNTPVLVFVHGGAWKQGDKNIYLELGNTFAGYYGLTTVIVNYQLSSDPWNAMHPTHVQDIAKAFAWVKNNIETYGGNPEDMTLFGQSAGAHLITLLSLDASYLSELGCSPDEIHRVIAMSGAYNLYDLVKFPLNPLDLSAVEVLEYKTLCANTFGSWDQDVLDAASPGKFVNAEMPPVHIIALNETDTFKDMPGFGADADQFNQQILNAGGQATLKRLSESDIDPDILALEFPGNTDGHYEEIYAINTPLWNSASTKMVAGYVGNYPEKPILSSPADNMQQENVPVTFAWLTCRGAIYYQLQIAADAGFESNQIVWDGQIGVSQWTVSGLETGENYFWRVRSVNGLGESGWSELRQFSLGELTDVPNTQMQPISFQIQAYPNPFNGAVMLEISVPEISRNSGSLSVYNVNGSLIEEQSIELHQGVQTVRWIPGSDLPTGIYLFHIQYGAMSARIRGLYIK